MSPTPSISRKKTTTRTLQQKKQRHEAITMLTAYDYSMAQAVDAAGMDSILVGDSLGMVVLGYETTLPVTMDDMLHHCKAVARGASYALLVGDMPFMSYQVSVEQAVHNAGRFLQEAGMDAVKLEGGHERLAAVQAIVAAGIPVMGHLGLTPQSVHQLGGFRTQGSTAQKGARIYADALALQTAGCFAIVLECVPVRLASKISADLDIPTIGIGAGGGCDGQVLVAHDVLGLFGRFLPRFVKQYAHLWEAMRDALTTYVQDVGTGAFPADEHVFTMPDNEWEMFLHELD